MCSRKVFRKGINKYRMHAYPNSIRSFVTHHEKAGRESRVEGFEVVTELHKYGCQHRLCSLSPKGYLIRDWLKTFTPLPIEYRYTWIAHPICLQGCFANCH